MRIIKSTAAFAALLLVLAASADAQRTTRRTTPAPKVVTSTAATAGAAAEMRAGAEKAAIQVKNVTKFIYVLGGVAKGIEDLDKDTRANARAKQTNETNKKEVIQAIRNLRAGLTALEVEFRTKPNLRKAVPQIDGIAILSGESESLALSGKFVDSGKPLLLIVEKLSDTLVALR
jgi:hypothetical protein